MKKFFAYAILAFIFCSIGFGGGYLIGVNSVLSQATNESAKLQGLSTAEYSSDAPAKACDVPKEKKSFSIEKIKAFFNL